MLATAELDQAMLILVVWIFAKMRPLSWFGCVTKLSRSLICTCFVELEWVCQLHRLAAGSQGFAGVVSKVVHAKHEFQRGECGHVGGQEMS